MLRMQADYVRMVCAGDAAKLCSSGFDLAKKREPVLLVDTPQHVVAAAFTPGTVRAKWGAVKGAHFFNVERAFSDPAAGEVEWQLVATTARQTLIVADLKPYQPVWLRVTAIGVNGPGYPSNVAMARAA